MKMWETNGFYWCLAIKGEMLTLFFTFRQVLRVSFFLNQTKKSFQKKHTIIIWYLYYSLAIYVLYNFHLVPEKLETKPIVLVFYSCCMVSHRYLVNPSWKRGRIDYNPPSSHAFDHITLYLHASLWSPQCGIMFADFPSALLTLRFI